MNLGSRIDKLEARTRNMGSAVVLYDDKVQCVEGKVVRMPTPEGDGLAVLADGLEVPILYEEDWKSQIAIFEMGTGKFRIRRDNTIAIIFRDVEISDYPR